MAWANLENAKSITNFIKIQNYFFFEDRLAALTTLEK